MLVAEDVARRLAYDGLLGPLDATQRETTRRHVGKPHQRITQVTDQPARYGDLSSIRQNVYTYSA